MAEQEDGLPPYWDGECPLCRNRKGNSHFFTDKFRAYYRCPRCSLIFVPPPWHVSAENEKIRYGQHNNDPDDAGYRNFLGRIIPFLEENLEPGFVRGLDFGCGPGPVLADMLKTRGYDMSQYDLYFCDDQSVLRGGYYDFITSTEVIEHIADPLDMIERFFSYMRPGGVLALMTRFYHESIHFKSWFYKDDETHLCFFSKESFLWLGECRGFHIEFRDKDMVIIKRVKTDNDRYET